MNENTLKGLVGGIVIGAIAAAGLIMGTGVAVMNDQAEAMATTKMQDALMDEFAKICVANYEALPDKAAHDAKLKALDLYDQRKYVETHKWAIMPGSTAPYRNTVDLCGDRISALLKQ